MIPQHERIPNIRRIQGGGIGFGSVDGVKERPGNGVSGMECQDAIAAGSRLCLQILDEADNAGKATWRVSE